MAVKDASGANPPTADTNCVVNAPVEDVARAKAPLTMLLKVILLSFVIVDPAVKVTGAVSGNVRTLAPVSVILPPTEIAVALLVKTRLVKGLVLPTAPPSVIAPAPGVKVSAVAPLTVLVVPEKMIFWLPAVVKIVDPEMTTGPVMVIVPDVVVVILPPTLMAEGPV